MTTTIRLYLVRHGETEYNRLGLVLGQSDSPLTDVGRRQAQWLGRHSSFWQPFTVDTNSTTRQQQPLFWRWYASDLVRAQETAQLLGKELGMMDSAMIPKDSIHNHHSDIDPKNPNSSSHRRPTIIPSPPPLRSDPRLRELAKGARQGLPRHWTMEQCVRERQKTVSDDPYVLPPPYETNEDGWRRIQEFLHEIVSNVMSEEEEETKDATTTTPREKEPNHHASPRSTKSILVVSHSGLLRVWLEQWLGTERLHGHPEAQVETTTQLLFIPNTSVTVLQFAVPTTPKSLQELLQPHQSAETVQIVHLTWAQHLHQGRGSDHQDSLWTTGGE